jgi:hypothetical protein
MSSGTLVVLSADFAYTDKCYRHAAMISMLCKDVLLEIFDFYQKIYNPGAVYQVIPKTIWNWHVLVHVCQRW